LHGGQTDRSHNALQLRHDIIVGEPEHTVSAGYKPLITSAVIPKARFEIVALAVNLNNKLAGMRDKISDVTAHWALPAKSHSCKSMCLQMTPQ
jgi:hypothetical protein